MTLLQLYNYVSLALKAYLAYALNNVDSLLEEADVKDWQFQLHVAEMPRTELLRLLASFTYLSLVTHSLYMLLSILFPYKAHI